MRIGSIAASAINAFGVDMLVRANNIANVNTQGFQSRNVTFETGAGGWGVSVASIYPDTSSGPMGLGIPTIAEAAEDSLAPGYVVGSNTDLAREFTHMIGTQHAFAANGAVIRAVDDLSGVLLNVLV